MSTSWDLTGSPSANEGESRSGWTRIAGRIFAALVLLAAYLFATAGPRHPLGLPVGGVTLPIGSGATAGGGGPVGASNGGACVPKCTLFMEFRCPDGRFVGPCVPFHRRASSSGTAW